MTTQQVQTRYVYLFHRADGCYKIGSSKNPQVRFWQVRPIPDAIIHTFPSENAMQVEFALQRRFADCHVEQEWFRLSQEDVDAICRLACTNSVDDLPPELQPCASRVLPNRRRNGSGSRHKKRHMIALTPRQYNLLAALARQEQRPMAWQARIAINRALVESGLLTEEEADIADDGE